MIFQESFFSYRFAPGYKRFCRD